MYSLYLLNRIRLKKITNNNNSKKKEQKKASFFPVSINRFSAANAIEIRFWASPLIRKGSLFSSVGVIMGANISGVTPEFDRSSEPRLSDLPENCVALIMMRLDPPEICRLARLSRVFRRASSADFIWEPKLPPSYRAIARKVFDEITLRKLLKKDLYAKLCRPNLFDGGTKVGTLFTF